MKRLLLLFALVSSSVIIGQTEDPEPTSKLDTLTIDFQVLSIHGNTAQIMAGFNKKYEVNVVPEINPFGYVLSPDRTYRIRIERDMNLVEEFQTRGQTRTLPARMIWFAPTSQQLIKDKMEMSKATEPLKKANH